MTAPVDLRSDTVTRPSPGMRQAMANAEVGDDVYGEDPTVLKLEAQTAALLGHEAGVFVPSGTMGNQLAVRVHTRPGDEVILEAAGHSYLYESGGLAGVSHAQPHPIDGEHGLVSGASIRAATRPRFDPYPRSTMVIVENTSNGGGGTYYDAAGLDDITQAARASNLAFHLDGARLWNAHVGSGLALDDIASRFDSASVCYSKGLGAPVGSVLVGDTAFVKEARRQRKMLGGGMRQVGVLAAAALYALEHHLPVLDQDHALMRRLLDGLNAKSPISCSVERFPTNIAYLDVGDAGDAAEVCQTLREANVLVNATGPKAIRVVTHRDLDEAAIDQAIAAFARL